ncbi:hypothetical protein MKZ38_007345 [Zalerion maritima]|uniref:C2 domain containing protein n=1 Tax=Zalerion maritima TaxID=339359 RepID=A0AAD5RWU1_9PEZI|nr:hypothetical protein MKZ38_007345 [Zalerion maritima]
MSTASRRSLLPNRNVNSVKSMDLGRRRSRGTSRTRRFEVSYEDAFSYALRVAYLHYLLQPRQKRRKFVAAPAPPKRHSTVGVAEMMNELKGRDSKNFKLPHSFHKDLEKRLTGVLSGQERIPGFNESGIKRSIANAYNSFTEADFRRSASKDRKIEQYILVFYSRATAACHAAAPQGDSYKSMADRHVALFMRLVISILKDHGGDRVELIGALQNLENKLLTHDQALYITNTSSSEGTYVEEEVPLSYDVKDMHMVQEVAKIFGKTNSDVGAVISSNKDTWTEEAGVKDIKTYLSRLESGRVGTLSARDFDLDEAFREWRKAELPMARKMLTNILLARPELNKTNTGDTKALPARPTSMYGTEQAYADLGRAVQGLDSGDQYGFDTNLGLGGMSLDEPSSIRRVEAGEDTLPEYTFIPTHPREYYKALVQYAMTYDIVHGRIPSDNFQPLSQSSLDMLMELCMWWRVPQFTRLVALLEVTAAKFFDGHMSVQELGMTFDYVKEDQPEVKKTDAKKPPPLWQYNAGLLNIPTSEWTIHDFACYRQTLQSVHTALQRELYQILIQTYRAKKAPSHRAICMILDEHIYGDSAFSQRRDDKEAFAQQLREGLEQAAMESYTGMLEKTVDENHENWNFKDVVDLGKAVVGLCKTLKKRFSKTPEIQGANPYRIYVETVFPSFENDAHEMVKRILSVSRESGNEMPVEEAFLLYHELNEIHDHHEEVLPDKPFAFNIEDLLAEFVWKYLSIAEEKTEELVMEAIKSDNFQVRTRAGNLGPDDEDRHSFSVIDMFRFFHKTKELLMGLEWRDAYQTAKFRTALSKVFATGIGKYCEEVEKMFSQEMDRKTAQELTAQQQGGSILKYAKDALATKEKPEPFQFYEESFVKLNNIEYAMLELDKLESTIDVEQCVKIVEGRDGPISRNTRAPSKYVFTVKMVEAEDLKACDPSGFSDPYVILCDEFQKRLYKTRIITRNLNPQWNESVDITVTQPINLIATIWDWDTFGDHDFVGRTSLKLDPRHFGDYLPREFWLDLDTQGRMLVKVSMEGERDDIQFHFGKAFRYLKRAERDMVRKVTDKLVAEINATISLETLRQLLSRGIGASITSLWNRRTSAVPPVTEQDIESVLVPLLDYFDDNFTVMKKTLTDVTMQAVMTRLWKEVLMAIETLLVPPLSDKPSNQKPLNQKELDVVFYWKEKLFQFFNAKDESGEALGLPDAVLKTPKWHDLGMLYFFYHEQTPNLIRESERMAAATQQRQQAAMQGTPGNRHTAPASLMVPGAHGAGAASHHVPAAAGGAFASMGTIRRGKSIAMSRNLGTMRRAKEEKRKEAQAEPSDDMILRILRMRPEAAPYLKERARQRERMQAVSAAAMIVRNSVFQGFNAGPPAGNFGRGGVPRR